MPNHRQIRLLQIAPQLLLAALAAGQKSHPHRVSLTDAPPGIAVQSHANLLEGNQDPQGPTRGSRTTQSPQAKNDGKTTTDSKIDLKLPKFTSKKPKFCKLIYGLEQVKPVVWVVVDGTDVYCDINRNGDLTEPTEKQSQAEKSVQWAADGIEVDSWKTYLKSKFEGMFQGALYPKGGATPQQAVVYHIGGPLKVLQGTINNRLGQKMDDVLFYTAIGTEYPGVARTELRYACFRREVVPELSIRYKDGSSAELLLDHKC